MVEKIEGDVIVGLIPSVMRRAFGSFFLFALGFLLLSIAFLETPDGLHWAFFLIVVGIASFYGGYRMWLVSGRMLELTENGLRMSDGTVIAALEHIAKVDRSFFAFKPSNGFLVTLNTTYPKTWVPGLWWRIGKRIGIGGLTSAADGKIMADTLAVLIAERDGKVDLS